jgi:hypothetical protein
MAKREHSFFSRIGFVRYAAFLSISDCWERFRIAIGEGPPPRGPQLDKLRGNADHTEVVPPRLRHPALARDEIRLVLSNQS